MSLEKLGEIPPADKPPQVKVFGVDLTPFTRQNQLLLLAAGNLSCSIGFAYLQEKVFLVEDFQSHAFVSLLTAISFSICGFLECYFTNDMVRKSSLKEYTQLSVFTMGGMYLTNWSLKYLNYPTRVMFKSSKVIPVMFVGVLLQGKRYNGMEYLSAFILVVGICVFTLGDSNTSPKFDILGVILISMGVICDAVTSNFEEKVFFKVNKSSHSEVMAYASLFGSLWAIGPLVTSGEIFPAISHAMEHPYVVYGTMTFSILGYCSSIFILVLIKHFGATEAEIVKSCRKVFTIILSFMLLSKPVSSMHVVGGLIFFSSIVLTVYVKSQRKPKSYAPLPKNDDTPPQQSNA